MMDGSRDYALLASLVMQGAPPPLALVHAASWGRWGRCPPGSVKIGNFTVTEHIRAVFN